MSPNYEFHRLGIKLKFAYSLVGLLLGLTCIIAGVILGLGGVTSHTAWTASALGLSTSMTDATPGVIVFVVGIFMVLITRFKVKEITEFNNAPSQHTPSPQPPAQAQVSKADEDQGSPSGPPSTSPSVGSSSSGKTVLMYNHLGKYD